MIERIHDSATHAEFKRALEVMFPNRKLAQLSNGEISRLGAAAPKSGPKWVVGDSETGMLVFFLGIGAEDTPVLAFGLELYQEPDNNDLKFARSYARIFNEDLRTASQAKKQDELWASLQQTRFSRAIGRFSPFSTQNFMRWLRAVESASSLRYEGQPFAASILMTKQLAWIEAKQAATFVRFPRAIRFERAILAEKWIRSLVGSSDLVLVGLSVAGPIIGLLTLTGEPGNESIIPPHSSLAATASIVIPGTMLFVAARTGDTYVLLPQGATFLKHQGRWRYINYKWLKDIIYSVVSESVGEAIIRIVLDASFDRVGCLIAVLDDQQDIGKSIRDHTDVNRPNHELRSFIKGLSATERSHWQIIRATAAIDGATIFSKTGLVLDAACMVGDPSPEDCHRVNQAALRRFSGARSTAGWNISIFGLSVKVSEDGPITVFQHGNIVLEMGECVT
jgi:hypothetical protein